MSTPSNKRDARREARKASIASAQAARRVDAPAQPTDTEDMLNVATPEATAESIPEMPSPVAAPTEIASAAPEIANLAPAATPEPIPATPEMTVPPVSEEPAMVAKAPTTSAGTPKTPVVGTGTAKPAASGTTKTPTRPQATSGTGKTPTRPTGTTPSKPAANAGNTTKTPTRPQANGTLTGSGVRAANGAAADKTAARAALASTEEEAFKTKRDTRREERLASINQVRAARQLALKKKKQRAQMIRYGTIAAIVVGFLIIFGLIALLIHNLSAPTHTKLVGPYGQNIACESMEEAAVHYHANLQIIINGKSQPLPANVGFSPTANPATATCLYWLHTHDTSGVIHIEAPQGSATRKFLLGDFFAIWAQNPSNSIAFGSPELSATNFFGHPIDKTHPLTVYINGKVWTGDPNTIVLSPHENIWMEYGGPLVTPSTYTFPAGE